MSLQASRIDATYTTLLQSIFVTFLAASIWSLFRRNRKASIPLISQLPGPPSQSWLKGNHEQLFGLTDGWEFHETLAEKYGPAVQIKGFFGSKQFYTFDPQAMHHILVKHVFSFTPIRTGGTLLFGNGLLNMSGEQHRKQRKMLNPVFSIAHMRSMMPIFYDVVDQLETALSQRVHSGPTEIDLLSWMTRTALELIGQSGFGYSFDNMVDDVPKHRYSIVIKELMPSLARLSIARTSIFPLVIKFIPTRIRTFLMNITPWKTLHEVRDMVNYMHELSVHVYQEKKHALEQGDEVVAMQIGRGKDLLSILIKDNMVADSEDKLNEDEIIAQMSTFIFAAMDTTSNGLSRILHLLAMHPDVQDKMRREILEARNRHQRERFSYDELVALPYLDAVCRETLRLHPPVTSLIRKSDEDTVIPVSHPVQGKDGNSEITEIFVPKSTAVVVSLLNANRSLELWGPDALEWKPERWLSPLPESITDSRIPAIYAYLMTFSGGSRACIGFKFSQLEMKVVLSMLVEKFNFSLAPKKSIFWQMSLISSPVVDGGDGHSQLPLIVELA
ncbi:cytochrome P450 [Rhodocollybia butyracea]|uniref:Cytochrome P450 n=1 Tax=Rhodocollybia butyracea TaxID=206335 RepID=A0A9P5PJM3_9AGAR|nr:cytochrome P450 [Rhodocollybia butyracea]